MGGNLLQSMWNLPPQRISTDDYYVIVEDIVSKLNLYGTSTHVKFFLSKEDHGDIDIIFATDDGNCHKHEFFFDLFHVEQHHKNGNIYSFPYHYNGVSVQVDIIIVSEKNYKVSQAYFAYEAGMAMGVVANKMRLKYGWKGLEIKVPLKFMCDSLPNDQYYEVLFEKDPKTIFEILGFDYNRFEQGFKTQVELFEWIYNSKYCNNTFYDYVELNHRNRIRNKKRHTYGALLEFIESKPPKCVEIDKMSIFNDILVKYPTVRFKIAEKSLEVELNNRIKQKFNGALVMELTDKTGKDVGQFIGKFRETYNVEMILSMTEEEIKDAVLNLC